GWLYLALGDRGCDVQRPEGDRLVLNGGGILRCRPDGADLHVFATGLRNIYDIALDEELNVFVRDNVNDGGNYMIRVCHSFMGADHGYPYLYQEHPDEALAPLADLARGSSAGGVAYLERAFPAAYQGGLFFCEWGKSVVFYARERKGAGFAPMKETEFAAGASHDPYGFRPTDIIVDRDGSLLVSDWADGQRPKRGRGRIYRIQYEGEKTRSSNSPDPERFRGVCTIARSRDSKTLFQIAESDSDPALRAQAVRAIGDLFDPVLVEHRIDATGGDSKVARRLSKLDREDPRVMFEVTVALGRLCWNESPAWLKANLGAPDAALAHAAVQTLRRSRNWPAVLKWLDTSLRSIALRALAEQAEVEAVDGLIRRLETSQDPTRRREYVELLSRVHRKPGPWVYWGFRPGPRPPNTESWERTEAIEKALDRTLNDPDREVRLATIRQMEREKIRVPSETLSRWLRGETKFENVAAILSAYESSKGGSEEKGASERHARLSKLALGNGGNVVRGREIYFNVEKSACSKCHRLRDQGTAIGPDLTGAGKRFSKIHIIESILEPSRAIAPAFRNLSLRLKDGQEFTGIRVHETESALTLGDANGHSHVLKKDQIKELQILNLSIMPEGIEGGLTDAEFVDLVAFLAEQK
ncbi:MAG TPA: HEAT repeat domain-containing protein, partial [Verrucomicrobiae bacterium]|nr:HEAT repeat domain-containing protein [Verrucomicrobiae bacterium]